MILFFILAFSYPIEGWQSEVLEEMQVRDYHFTRFPSVRPYDLKEDQMDSYYDSLSGTDIEPPRTWLANSSFDLRYDTLKVLRFKPRLYADWSDFSFILQPVIKFGRDSMPPDRVFAGLFAADNERASVRYSNPYFGFFIGREKFALGPSPRYNLILSGYGPAMDWLHYRLGSRIFRISYYLSQLDDMTCKPYEFVGDTFTRMIQARRFLVIKRLDVSPAAWINFSFSEAAAFGGENYTLTPYQFNPVVLLHTYQHNDNKDANIFFNLDGKIFFKQSAIYAALLVDDFQLDPDPNGEPNHLGINIGLESADRLFNRTFFMVEYTRVSRWTYCIFAPYDRYQYQGHPIGSPYGPDYDEVFGKYVCHIRPAALDLYLQAAYLRKGENQVNSIWPIPDPERVPGTEFPANNFLSGVVQRSVELSAGVRIFARPNYALDMAFGFIQAVNYRHLSGVSKIYPTVRFQFDLLDLFHR
jgi:hypothetical protein